MLDGKCVVVVGGTSGIGRALALGMAEAGADVVASSRSREATEETSAAIREIGRKTIAQPVDVTSKDSIQELYDATIAAMGHVDVLVNCAGVTQRVPTLECSEDTWNRIFDINFFGTVRACQIFGKAMIERGEGRILNIASLATFVAFHEVAAYGASKAAVGALTRSLAVEWAPHDVLVNAIAPGLFPTALNSQLLASPRGKELLVRTPMQRFGEASELISTAIYLASEQTSFTTGQIIAVDGGFLASGVNQ